MNSVEITYKIDAAAESLASLGVGTERLGSYHQPTSYCVKKSGMEIFVLWRAKCLLALRESITFNQTWEGRG